MQKEFIECLNKNTTLKYRMFFTKLGKSKYISHLDLVRLFQRAFERANIKIWKTMGFNPHTYLTFALPLSLGIESLCESVDLKLPSDSDSELIKHLINKKLPEGIKVLKMHQNIKKITEIKSANYKITLFDETIKSEKIKEKIELFLSNQSIIVDKKSKHSINKVDIKSSLKIIEIDFENEQLYTRINLPTGTEWTINPKLVVECFEQSINKKIDNIQILRESILCGDGSEFL